MVQCHYRRWRVETHCTDTARDRCFVTLWRFQRRICYAGMGLGLLYRILCVTKETGERALSPWWHTITRGRQSVVCMLFLVSTHHIFNELCWTCFYRAFDFISKYVLIPPDSIEEATQDDLSNSVTMPFDSGMAGSLFERRFQEIVFLTFNKT